MIKVLFSFGIVTVCGVLTSLSLSSCSENTAAAPPKESQPFADRNAEEPAVPASQLTETVARKKDDGTRPVTAAVNAPGKPEARAPKDQLSPNGLDAMAKAAGAKKSLFLFLYKDDSAPTAQMRRVFEAAVEEAGDKAESFAIDATNPAEKATLEKLGVGRAPMPLALVLAPNGAITGGFPVQFTAKQLVESIPSPCMEKCLKALQERKLVLLCVQNDTTKSNDAAMRGIRDFKSDPRYAASTEVVTLDPADEAEARTLSKLRVDPGTGEAMTVFLAPPGSVIAQFKGATSKSSLLGSLQKAMSACSPSSGCCPPKPKS